MKKTLNEMSRDEKLAIVLGHSSLREKFESYVIDCEFDWLSDKMSFFERGAIDYEYGICTYSWISVKNTWEALRGVEEAIKCFCATEKVTKLAQQARRLADSNLFEYTVEKLVEAWYKDEILDVIEYLEKIGYALYCEDAEEVEKLAGDHFDCFLDNGYLDDYFEEDGEVFVTLAVA